jgi:hypothetical protein
MSASVRLLGASARGKMRKPDAVAEVRMEFRKAGDNLIANAGATAEPRHPAAATAGRNRRRVV